MLKRRTAGARGSGLHPAGRVEVATKSEEAQRKIDRAERSSSPFFLVMFVVNGPCMLLISAYRAMRQARRLGAFKVPAGHVPAFSANAITEQGVSGGNSFLHHPRCDDCAVVPPPSAPA